jgi:hypothetical protein
VDELVFFGFGGGGLEKVVVVGDSVEHVQVELRFIMIINFHYILYKVQEITCYGMDGRSVDVSENVGFYHRLPMRLIRTAALPDNFPCISKFIVFHSGSIKPLMCH